MARLEVSAGAFRPVEIPQRFAGSAESTGNEDEDARSDRRRWGKSEVADLLISVPSKSTPRIQELHLPIYHFVCEQVELRLSSKS